MIRVRLEFVALLWSMALVTCFGLALHELRLESESELRLESHVEKMNTFDYTIDPARIIILLIEGEGEGEGGEGGGEPLADGVYTLDRMRLGVSNDTWIFTLSPREPHSKSVSTLEVEVEISTSRVVAVTGSFFGFAPLPNARIRFNQTPVFTAQATV